MYAQDLAKQFRVLICDECHFIKDPSAQRTKATVPLVKDARRAILLSGTPALNKPKELFQQVGADCSRATLSGGMERMGQSANGWGLALLLVVTEHQVSRAPSFLQCLPGSDSTGLIFALPHGIQSSSGIPCAAGGAGASSQAEDEGLWGALLPGKFSEGPRVACKSALAC